MRDESVTLLLPLFGECGLEIYVSAKLTRDGPQWFCNVSAWLRGLTFPKIPFPMFLVRVGRKKGLTWLSEG